ncbi:RES family NAD+ phosphorylase [Cohnella sp. GCM10027633]|uniref:RES family NAD+ phosphorylase n=1 Tax=unclassified Cohnella TaxID=2636738 RepID=UPI0036398FCD
MVITNDENMDEIIVACSDCFHDQGLRLDAKRIGCTNSESCPNCMLMTGNKLTLKQLKEIVYRFFVWGSLVRCEYGAFPGIQFNELQETSIYLNENLEKDMKVFEKILGIGFFYYGPRAWMYGDIEPLKDLLDTDKRRAVIKQILEKYPKKVLTINDSPLYRIRSGENLRYNSEEFDSPPDEFLGSGRLDSVRQPVLYASPDLDLCIHEMRAKMEDELYVATLLPKTSLKLLNLSVILNEDESEFDSLDLA